MASDRQWSCAMCGRNHVGLAMVFGPTAPFSWLAAGEEERAAGLLTPDQCVVSLGDEQHCFIRGHIEIPVSDAAEDVFVWSVWVSLSEANMELMGEHWEAEDRADVLPPMFAWLCSELPYEPSTLSLPTLLRTRDVGVVPLIELDAAVDHPLAKEQREGISLHRVAEINKLILGTG